MTDTTAGRHVTTPAGYGCEVIVPVYTDSIDSHKDLRENLRVQAERLRRWLSTRRSDDALDATHRAQSSRLTAKASTTVEARKLGETDRRTAHNIRLLMNR